MFRYDLLGNVVHKRSTYTCWCVLLQTGTCHEEEDGAPMIILELMPYGDLKDFLIKQK